jgi:hypothetical protein
MLRRIVRALSIFSEVLATRNVTIVSHKLGAGLVAPVIRT